LFALRLKLSAAREAVAVRIWPRLAVPMVPRPPRRLKP
jgi:hypothetical protein